MLFILLPVHNRRPVTENFARALARQSVKDFHLLLIDDGSSDGTADAVTAILPNKSSVLRGSGTWWWGGSLNQGWHWLRARTPEDDDIICICNDDVDLPDDFLERGMTLLSRHPASLIIAKERDPQTGSVSDSCISVDYKTCKTVPAKPGDQLICAPTRGLFIRWSDMRRVGSFHPFILPHYFADLEWTFRAARGGLTICREDNFWLVPHHDRSGLRDLRAMPLLARTRYVFSKKYVGNPFYWGVFVTLSFPARYWPSAFLRIAFWTAGAVLGR
jgi:GT2 family glycosyltransferase